MEHLTCSDHSVLMITATMSTRWRARAKAHFNESLIRQSCSKTTVNSQALTLAKDKLRAYAGCRVVEQAAQQDVDVGHIVVRKSRYFRECFVAGGLLECCRRVTMCSTKSSKHHNDKDASDATDRDRWCRMKSDTVQYM